MKRLSCTIAALLVLAGIAFAADFWTKKPYTQWSSSEAVRILTESPWSQTVTMRLSGAQQTSRTGAMTTNQSDFEPAITYVVSLRSARPVRQARVRMMAIDQKYDKMDDATKAAFDAKWRDYVTNDPADTIVVSVSYRSNVPEHERRLATYFQSQTLELVKDTTFLSVSDGRKLPAVAYMGGQGNAREFQVGFERPANLPDNASFTVEFRHPDIPSAPAQRISARYQLKNMRFADGVAY